MYYLQTINQTSAGTSTPLSFAFQKVEITSAMVISAIAILVYIIANTLREIVQIYQQKWHYLIEPNNLVSWLISISALIMVLPVFSKGIVSDNHFSAASITVFLSWFNLLLFLQRFDQVTLGFIIILYRWFKVIERVVSQIMFS